MTECDHAPSKDPRFGSTCRKCGKLIPAKRDRLFEEVFLKRVVREVARRAGHDAQVYAETVRERLTMGATRYGERLNDDRDLLAEALEEPADVAGYALLELARVRNDHPPDGLHHHLFEAAVYSAIADAHLRAARVALREG